MSAEQGVRLAKRVAEQYHCSRRQAELYIEAGQVTVDGGVVEEPGARVQPNQQVQLQMDLQNQANAEPAAEPQPVTLLWHKPIANALAATITAYPATAETLANCIQAENQQHLPQDPRRFLKRMLRQLQICSSLATSASGLVVLSQDWRVLRKFQDDAHKLEQEFIVELDQAYPREMLSQILASGIATEIPGLKLSWQNETRLRLVHKGGLRGEYEAPLARLWQRSGWQIKDARRIRLGRLPLAGIEAGRWRLLQEYERF